jgi:hypothetical protein
LLRTRPATPALRPVAFTVGTVVPSPAKPVSLRVVPVRPDAIFPVVVGDVPPAVVRYTEYVMAPSGDVTAVQVIML